MGYSFKDYGLTIYHKDESIEKISKLIDKNTYHNAIEKISTMNFDSNDNNVEKIFDEYFNKITDFQPVKLNIAFNRPLSVLNVKLAPPNCLTLASACETISLCSG